MDTSKAQTNNTNPQNDRHDQGAYELYQSIKSFLRIVIYFIAFITVTFTILMLLSKTHEKINSWITTIPGLISIYFLKQKLKNSCFFEIYKNNAWIKLIVHSTVVSVVISSTLVQFTPIRVWAADCSNAIVAFISNDVPNENDSTIIVRNTKATFIISNLDLSNMLTDDHLDEVYLSSTNYENDIKLYFQTLFHTKKANTKSFNHIQKRENSFLNKIELSKKRKDTYGANDKWYDSLPNESELIRIISSQEEHAKKHPDFSIYNKLSNNYQRIALEYLNQDANIATVKYYFTMSLLCDYHCIEYATTKEQYNIALNRIYYRYSDIYSVCVNTFDEELQLETWLNQLKAYK